MILPNIGPIQPNVDSAPRPVERSDKGEAFEKLLRDRLPNDVAIPSSPSALKFSAHALNRIKDRGINMGGDLQSKLEKAVDTAAQKGAKESLILSKDAAFIVSVKNKTVITVMDRGQMDGNVFTNIDSTVVI